MLESKISTREKDGKIQAIVSFKVNGQWKQKTKQGFTTESKPPAQPAVCSAPVRG